MKTRLILVEGLPGTGKSTTAAMIAEELRKRGEKVVCADEGEREHPADYADYDFSDFETERSKILKKWKSFTKKAAPDTVYVFNCLLLQNPMCETMMRFGLDQERSERYISEIADVMRPMEPIVVYLSEPDVKRTIDGILKERGTQWLNAVIDYHVEQGYGKANGLRGYEGYIECLKERKNRELAILKTLGLNVYTVGRDITEEEFEELFVAVGWIPPAREQITAAIRHSAEILIVRKNGKPIAMLGLMTDRGMHWFVKEFIVRPEYQGKMIGRCLYRFAERYILSTMKPGWRICVDLRSRPGKEDFYEKCGFLKAPCAKHDLGHGMEKMIEKE